MPLAVGERFTMSADAEPYEVRNQAGKRVLARFVPGLGYRVTGKNIEIANRLVDIGQAKAGGTAPSLPGTAGIALGTTPARVKGSARTGKAK